MPIGRGSVASAERALTGARERCQREIDEREQRKRELEEARARRPSLAEDPDAFADNEASIAKLTAETRRLGLTIEKRERDVVEMGRRLALAVYEEALGERDAAAAAAVLEAKAVAAHLSRVVSSAKKLNALRAELDRLEARASELCLADVEGQLAADEPDFPEGLDAVVALIEGGPRQPQAAEKARREQGEESRHRTEEAQIAQAVREDLRLTTAELERGDGYIDTRLPEHLRDVARGRLAAEREKLRDSKTNRLRLPA